MAWFVGVTSTHSRRGRHGDEGRARRASVGEQFRSDQPTMYSTRGLLLLALASVASLQSIQVRARHACVRTAPAAPGKCGDARPRMAMRAAALTASVRLVRAVRLVCAVPPVGACLACDSPRCPPPLRVCRHS